MRGYIIKLEWHIFQIMLILVIITECALGKWITRDLHTTHIQVNMRKGSSQDRTIMKRKKHAQKHFLDKPKYLLVVIGKKKQRQWNRRHQQHSRFWNGGSCTFDWCRLNKMIIAPFLLEKLREMVLAIQNALKGCIIWWGYRTTTVWTLETWFVIGLPLHCYLHSK